MSLCGARCTEPLKDKDEILTCGGCKVKFHRSCSVLSKEAYDIVNKLSALSFRCLKCQTNESTLTTLFEKLRLQITRFEKKNDENFAKIDKRFANIENGMAEGEKQVRQDITKVVEKCNASMVENEKWIDIVKKPRKPKSPVVHIVPKDKATKNDATKAAVKSSINPADFKVQRMRNAANGGVVIDCEDDINCSNLVEQAAAKLGSDFVVKKPVKRLPRIKLLRVVEAAKENDNFLADLKKRNPFIGEKIEVIKREEVKFRGKKSDNTSNIVIQVDGETHKKIMEKGRLLREWQSVRVVDNVYIRRCYKCMGFNHNAVDCKHSACCSRCASNDHQHKECQSTTEKCINCAIANKKFNMHLEENHSAWSRECAIYARKLAISRQAIDYVD